MKLEMTWDRPILLRDGQRQDLIYDLDEERLPKAAGIYVFGRKWAGSFEALYVGQATNIKGRVEGQLNNLKLMLHLKKAKNGRRFLLVGRFVSKPGQQRKKCLGLIERALIRHYLSEGHDLVNVQGTRLRQHEINSAGKQPKKFVPALMYVERGKVG